MPVCVLLKLLMYKNRVSILINILGKSNCKANHLTRFVSCFECQNQTKANQTTTTTTTTTTRNKIYWLQKMGKGGYYAVRNGRSKGVYGDWSNCEQQVKGHPGAQFKRFDTLAAANAYMSGGSSGQGSSSSSSSSSRSSYGSGSGSSSSYSRSSYGGGSRSSYSNNYSSFSHGTPSSRSNFSSNYHSAPSYSTQKNSKNYSSRSSSSYSGSNSGNYYAVKSNNPSIPDKIFNNWSECQSYTKGQRGLSFKKFDSIESSKNFISGNTDSADYGFIGSDASTFASNHRAPRSKTVRKEQIYCDGSSLNNGRGNAAAGIGVHFRNGTSKDVAAPLDGDLQTNNRAELQAAKTALDTAYSSLKAGENIDYTLHTDSEYVAKLLNDRYSSYTPEQLNLMPNSDIVKPLIKSFAQVKQYYKANPETFGSKKFEVDWVKGHNGQEGNEIADELARKGASMK